MIRPGIRLIVAISLLLIGCESDDKKYERLQSELYAAEAPLRIADDAAAKDQPQCPELTNLSTNQYLAVCTDRLSKARTKVALLQRDMNKFMSGR